MQSKATWSHMKLSLVVFYFQESMSSAESEMSQEPSPAPPPKDEDTSPKPDTKMGKSSMNPGDFETKLQEDYT